MANDDVYCSKCKDEVYSEASIIRDYPQIAQPVPEMFEASQGLHFIVPMDLRGVFNFEIKGHKNFGPCRIWTNEDFARKIGLVAFTRSLTAAQFRIHPVMRALLETVVILASQYNQMHDSYTYLCCSSDFDPISKGDFKMMRTGQKCWPEWMPSYHSNHQTGECKITEWIRVGRLPNGRK